MTDTVDRLLDYVQAVYTSVSEEKYNLFDKDVEENKKEYEKWEADFKLNASMMPLGLKREDFVLRNLAMEIDEESEEEEEEEEEVDDYYEETIQTSPVPS